MVLYLPLIADLHFLLPSNCTKNDTIRGLALTNDFVCSDPASNQSEKCLFVVFKVQCL